MPGRSPSTGVVGTAFTWNVLRSYCPVYWLTLVVAPLFCALLFTSLMRSGLPADLPIGLVDMDGSATTRNLARNLDAFQNCHIAERYASPTEARAAMQRGDIYAFYYIPEGTTQKLMSQRSPCFAPML